MGAPPKSLSIFVNITFFGSFVFVFPMFFFRFFCINFEARSMFILVLVLQCQPNDRRGRFWGEFFNFFAFQSCISNEIIFPTEEK